MAKTKTPFAFSCPAGLEDTLDHLRRWARNNGLRADWHEPHGVKARVVGRVLDNAFGETGEGGEKVIILTNEEGHELRVNLASVLALACRD